MDYAVRVDRISKLFRIGAMRDPRTLREMLTDAVSRRSQRPRDEKRDLWALRDVSFDVRRGEAIGIIGQNGAGKSTLLKILSRITEPTSGRIELHGRVSSLLEVGTGFHPELTGRENIQLNGAILGMTRHEIRERFDDIVDFAEIARFIDTPVKYYSSGMYMRLAFAVAAHLEPEILVVDEVLAVGDAAFQAKCLRKMNDVASHGRTVLFVSHNMPAVKTLCKTAVRLDQGEVVDRGEASGVVDRYLRETTAVADRISIQQQLREMPADPVLRIYDIAVLQDGAAAPAVLSHRPLEIRIEYEVFESTAGLHVHVMLYDLEDIMIFETLHNGTEPGLPLVRAGRYVSTAMIPAEFLAPRPYQIRVTAAIHAVRTLLPAPVRIAIDVQPTGIVNRAYAGFTTTGRLAPNIEWHTETLA
jgi:lipopolysaccharide transport system ATP-binding protein